MLRIRHLVLAAAFAAIYIIYAATSSIFFRAFTRSFDIFIVTTLLFTVLYMEIERAGAATLLALVTGIILFFLPGVPAPAHILASLFANALIFDLYLQRTSSFPSRIHITVAAVLGSIAMAVVGLLVVLVSGVLEEPLPPVIWAIALITDPIAGAIGALLGFNIAKRISLRPELTRQV